MKLQLEHIQGYLAHGLMVKISENPLGGEIHKLSGVLYDGMANLGEGGRFGFINRNFNCFKPILRKLDLTISITVNGVEIVPIVDLAKIIKPELNFELGDGCSAFSDDYYYKLNFYNGVFDLINESHQGITIKQLPLFKWLYANKYDLDGLIDAGLAVDADTLEINPYNS